MSLPPEMEIVHLKAEIKRLDTEIHALKDRILSLKGDIAVHTTTVQTFRNSLKEWNERMDAFWTEQWPAVENKIGQLWGAVDSLKSLTANLAALDAKLDNVSTRTWHIYIAIAVAGTGGSAIGSELMKLLFGG